VKIYEISGNTLTEIQTRTIFIEYSDTLPRMSGIIGLKKRILETESLRFVWDNLTMDFDIVRVYQEGKNWYARIQDKTGFYFNNIIGRNWYFKSGTLFAEMIQTLIGQSVEYEGISGEIANMIIIPKSMTRMEAVSGITKDLCMDLEYRNGFKLRDIPQYPSIDLTSVYTTQLETESKINIITVTGTVLGQEFIHMAYNYEDIAQFGEFPGETYQTNITTDKFSIERLAEFKLELINYKESYSFKTKVQDIRINDIIVVRNASNIPIKMRVRRIILTGNFMQIEGIKK